MLHLELLALAAWCCSLCTQVEPFSEIRPGRGTRLLDQNRSFQTYQSLFLSCSRSSLILPRVGIRQAASLHCSHVIRLVEKVGVRKLVQKWKVRTVKGGGRCPNLCTGSTLVSIQPYSPSLTLFHCNLPHQVYRKLQFTCDNEVDGVLNFLDVKVKRENGGFSTSHFVKPIFSGLYTNFSACQPDQYKFGLVYTLVSRIFRLCSSMYAFHMDIMAVKGILRSNGFPSLLIDKAISKFVDRQHRDRPTVMTAQRKPVYLVLPYLGEVSIALKQNLLRLIKESYFSANVRIVFKCPNRLSSCFLFRSKLPDALCSGVIYQFTCDGCKAIYFGKTRRHLGIRVAEHLGVSALTGKRLQVPQDSAIYEHCLQCSRSNRNPDFSDFSVVCTGETDLQLCIAETLHISKDKPLLNRNITSYELKVF